MTESPENSGWFTSFDAPQGYLKGYHVFVYHPGEITPPEGRLFREESGLTIDEFLTTGRDGEYRLDPRIYPVIPLYENRCHVVTGVYKVFANGNWLTLDSDWSANFDETNPDQNQRCPTMPTLAHWCDQPLCSAITIPPPPTNVGATQGSVTNQIRVSWTPPAIGGVPIANLAGYFLYVNDPAWTDPSSSTNAKALFRKDRPYLRLEPDVTSVTLSNMDPCRQYSFYLAAIGESGRLSDPSNTANASSLPPPIWAPLQPPTNLRVRLWTANEGTTYAQPPGGLDNRRIIRLKWDYACNPQATFQVWQSTNLVDWAPGSGQLIVSDDKGFEQNMWPSQYPVGTTIYYRVKAVVDSQESDFSAPVPAKVIPYDSTLPAPPAHLDAHYIYGSGVRLHWCPNPWEDAIAGYRIYRATRSGGPYSIVRSLEPGTYWTDSDPTLDPENQWYYYVIAAVRNPGGANEQVSPFSNENVAGHADPIPGSNHPFDPDSVWYSTHDDDADWKTSNCQKDYVMGPKPGSAEPTEPSSLNPTAMTFSEECQAAKASESRRRAESAAPYRVVGIAASFHYTYYHLDHLGTPRVLTDSNGLAVQSVHLLPFGEEMPVEPGMNTRKFTGHERDGELGVDYMKARYYQAKLGRFSSVDPSRASITLAAPQSWNSYTYTYNQPIAYVDENGLWPKATHYSMSFFAGIFSGLSNRDSHVIGSASFSVDLGATAPWHFWDWADQRRWHAFGDASIAAIRSAAEKSSSLWDLGRNLHPLQDWYPHNGYPVFFGHAFATQNPDCVSCSVGIAFEAFVDTFYTVQTALLNLGRLDRRTKLTAEQASLMRLLFTYEAEVNPDESACVASSGCALSLIAPKWGLTSLVRYFQRKGYAVYVDGVLQE